MNPFYRPQVTDELLSAYIDGDVTAEEKELIERTVQVDASVAWRLESLQQTVSLLRSLPEVSLPRSFVLTEADVAPLKSALPPPQSTARRTVRPLIVEPEHRGFWQSFLDFLQGGSPLLRNMAATGVAVWLVLLGATLLNPTRMLQQPSIQIDTMKVAATPQEAVAAVPVAQAPAPQSDPLNQTTNRANNETQQNSSAQPAADNATQAQSQQSDSQTQPQAQSATVAAKAAPVVAEANNGGNDAARSAAVESAPALAAAGGGTEGNAADPLAQAMSDTGSEGSPANADPSLAMAASANDKLSVEFSVDSAVGVAAVSGAENVTSDVTISETLLATTVQSEGIVTETVVNPADTQPIPAPTEEIAEETVVQTAQDAAPAAAAPAPAQQQIVEATIVPVDESANAVAPQEPVQDQAVQDQAVQSQEVPPMPLSKEVAIAQPIEEAAPVEIQNQDLEPVANVVSTPLFDPVRMQIAQVTVALVTAVLALFWLASQRGKKRR